MPAYMILLVIIAGFKIGCVFPLVLFDVTLMEFVPVDVNGLRSAYEERPTNPLPEDTPAAKPVAIWFTVEVTLMALEPDDVIPVGNCASVRP